MRLRTIGRKSGRCDVHSPAGFWSWMTHNSAGKNKAEKKRSSERTVGWAGMKVIWSQSADGGARRTVMRSKTTVDTTFLFHPREITPSAISSFKVRTPNLISSVRREGRVTCLSTMINSQDITPADVRFPIFFWFREDKQVGRYRIIWDEGSVTSWTSTSQKANI